MKQTDFADRLRIAMNGESQTSFAKRLKCPDTTVTNWLNGGTVPGGEYLRAIGRVTGASVDWLLGFEDIPARRIERARISGIGSAVRDSITQGGAECGAHNGAFPWGNDDDSREIRRLWLAELSPDSVVARTAIRATVRSAARSLQRSLVHTCDLVLQELTRAVGGEDFSRPYTTFPPSGTVGEMDSHVGLLRHYGHFVRERRHTLLHLPNSVDIHEHLLSLARTGNPVCVDRSEGGFQFDYGRWPAIEWDRWWRAGVYVGTPVPVAALSIVWRDNDADCRILAPWKRRAARLERAASGTWVNPPGTQLDASSARETGPRAS